jgi:hypothetical protein
VVGIATVQGALSAIEAADAQFAELRRRIDELLPDLTDVGPNQCAFSFNGATDILALLQVNKIYIDRFTAEKSLAGYCFDATAGQHSEPFNCASHIVHGGQPFDNPTTLGTAAWPEQMRRWARSPSGEGRYLLILNDRGGMFGRTAAGRSPFFPTPTDELADPALVIDLATGQSTVLNHGTRAASTGTHTPAVSTGRSRVHQRPSPASSCSRAPKRRRVVGGNFIST